MPVAITAFSAKQRSLIGIQTVQDLTDYTPGLSFTSVSNRPYVRGVGRNTDNLSTASAVATYYNGVYYGANASTLLQKDDLFIGNIEVDRRPQNSIHGSNADGGTISYTSQRPTDTFYAEARAGAANFGEYFTEERHLRPDPTTTSSSGSAPTTPTCKAATSITWNPASATRRLATCRTAQAARPSISKAKLEGHWDKLDVWAMAFRPAISPPTTRPPP